MDGFSQAVASVNDVVNGVVCLSGLVVKITKNYSARKIRKDAKAPEPMYSAFPEIQREQEERQD